MINDAIVFAAEINVLRNEVIKINERLAAIEAKVNAIYDWYTAKPEGD